MALVKNWRVSKRGVAEENCENSGGREDKGGGRNEVLQCRRGKVKHDIGKTAQNKKKQIRRGKKEGDPEWTR